MRCLVTIILILFCSSLTYAEDKCLCIAEHAAGFEYDETSESWKSTTFKTNSKYIVTPATEEDQESKSFVKIKFTYVVKKVGEKTALIFCENPFNEQGYISCQSILGDSFDINLKSGQFIHKSDYAYWIEAKEGEKRDTPYMEIGKCSKF